MQFINLNIEICRCERSEYEQFASLHYLQGDICRGASCFKFRINDEIGAFASLLAMPLRGDTNALIFHRIVVLKQFQGLGLSSMIVNLLGGIFTAEGKSIYLKTDSKRMGKMLRNNNQWMPTLMNLRTRKLSKPDHERNKARHRRAAFSFKYIGHSIIGYESIAKLVRTVRNNALMGKYLAIDTLGIAKILYGISNPVFLRDALISNFDYLSDVYGVIYGEDYNATELYTTDIIIRRKPQRAKHEYLKRLLFINALLHISKQKSTIESLIYNLLKENLRQQFNLSSVEVIKMAIRAYNTDISKYAHLIERSKVYSSYRVNVEVARERGLSPKQASNIARKQIRAQRIAKIYSPDLTDEENIRIMLSHGLKISLSTLKRWRKENNFTRYNKSVIPTI